MSPRSFSAVAIAAAATLLAVPSAFAAGGGRPDDESATPVTIGVIGDSPYGSAQIANFPADVAQINADPKVRLVLHLGDIKNGSTRCDTSYFEQVRAAFDGFDDPLVYTPGDNEWTDCHRANNGAYDPLGRLATLRDVFFDQPGVSLGRRAKRLDAQAAPYVENVRWSESRVEFGTLNVPGSNNDWLGWFNQSRTQRQVDEVTNRTQADLAWLDRIFDAAIAQDRNAVVIGIQADMWDPNITGDPTQYDHFTPLVQRLADRARAFPGQVLLLNGDSHIFTDDHPLDGSQPGNLSIYGVTRPVPNLRRITVNGSTTPCHEYLRLLVDPRSPGVFSAEQVPFEHQDGTTGTCTLTQ